MQAHLLQELTDDGYEGDYHLEWPYKHNSTTPWERRPVHASLKHNFLESGHRGALQVTGSFTMDKPVQISYEFKVWDTRLFGSFAVSLGSMCSL